MSGESSSNDTLSDLRELLSSFQGREYSGEINEETLFFGDLGFVSIDAIVLGETLEAHYGRSIPFQRFLAKLADENVQDIAVGRLAEFLTDCLANTDSNES